MSKRILLLIQYFMDPSVHTLKWWKASSKFIMAENHLLIPVQEMDFLTWKCFIKCQAIAAYLCFRKDLNSYCLDFWETHWEFLMSRQSAQKDMSVYGLWMMWLYKWEDLMLNFNSILVFNRVPFSKNIHTKLQTTKHRHFSSPLSALTAQSIVGFPGLSSE